MNRFFLTSLFLVTALAAWARQADADVVGFLQETYGVSFAGNNRIAVFRTGQEKFDDLFAAVRQARRSIHLEYFNFRNDSLSRELFQLLESKATEGVEVRAVFDGFGNSSNNRPLRRRHLDSIRSHGVEIYEFDPVRFPYVTHIAPRDHRKIVIIDGVLAYTGGMNVADYYVKGKPEFGAWRDIHLRVEGDAVAALQAVFLDFWNRWTGQQVSGPQFYPSVADAASRFTGLRPAVAADSAGVVSRGPSGGRRIIHDTFVRAIDGAQRQIQLINPYFTLCPHVRRALKRASRRGVDVQVMVSAKSDIPVTPRIVEHNAHRLMKAGVKVFFFEGGFHHSKIMMVDSVMAYVGSANLDSRSLSFDYECNLLLTGRAATRPFQQVFTDDRDKSCFQLTPEAWKSRFKPSRRFAAWFWQFLAPFV